MPRKNYRPIEMPATPEALADAAELSRRLMTLPEVAVALRLRNAGAARNMVNTGKLPAVKVGRRLMVARMHVEAIVEALEARPVRLPRGGGSAGAAPGPFLRGPHTLVACFEARASSATRRVPPFPAVDAVCLDHLCPMAAPCIRDDQQKRFRGVPE